MQLMIFLKKTAAWLLTVLISFGSLPVPDTQFHTMNAPDTIIRTGTWPAAYTKFRDFRNALSDYPFFEKYCFAPYQEEKDMGTYVIPGLKVSAALDREGKACVCGNMIPQGICATPDYLIVSCYCHDNLHNSVLQVIDKKTGQFVKTVVLPDRPHAGSVAYDPISDDLWISTGKTGKASVSCLDLARIKQYSFNAWHQPIEYNKVWKVPSLVRNSYMTYYNRRLYAGTFVTGIESSPLQQIYLDESGLIEMNDSPTTILSNSIASDCQGVAMNSEYIFASHSYGPYRTSTLALYPAGVSQLFEINALKTWILPECMEQIWLDGDRLYLLFESAGWPFRNDTIHHVDRIVSVSLKELLAS